MVKVIRAGVAIVLFTLVAFAQGAQPSTILTHRGEIGSFVPPNSVAPSTLTVPAETEVKVQMLSGLHTRINRVNDPITAKLLEPVYVNGRVALPPGTLLDGRVTMIRPSGHLRRSAELGLRFDRVLLPDGEEKPITGVLAQTDLSKSLHLRLDAEGHLTGNRDLSWKSIFGGFAAFGTFGAIKAAALTGSAATWALPAGGAALIGYEIFWSRGREVNLPPETHCRVRLNYPLTVLVRW
jgi:hypothetical protein